MRVDLFDYQLPPELIAQTPPEQRDASRLLVVDRNGGRRHHLMFTDLPQLLRPGDLLVLNDTKVVPARLCGVRDQTGGRWEGLFLREERGRWEVMTKTRGKPRPRETIRLYDRSGQAAADASLILDEKSAAGTWWVLPRMRPDEDTASSLGRVGSMPLPPYIRGGIAEASDSERYQTVYASRPGAVAAPTAGLHFSRELLDQLASLGIEMASVTLHVGPGTFQPVAVEETADHVMHAEWSHLSKQTADRIMEVRQRGGRIVAVGTTVVRTLESAAAASPAGTLHPFSGSTRLFITPPYTFQIVQALITNFHLPRSTLLMLVSAFAGLRNIQAAYREAIEKRYRFYSYGDAMLIA